MKDNKVTEILMTKQKWIYNDFNDSVALVIPSKFKNNFIKGDEVYISIDPYSLPYNIKVDELICKVEQTAIGGKSGKCYLVLTNIAEELKTDIKEKCKIYIRYKIEL